jgi:transcriptional regulator with XRE-family HTH domain
MTFEARSGAKFIDVRVGTRVAMRRVEQGVTLPNAAKALGLATAELTARERGKVRFEPSELMKLATLLDVLPGYFFEGLEIAKRDTPFDE